MKTATDNPESGARDRLLIDVDEARELLGGVARSYVYVLMTRGELPAIKLGRRRMIVMRDLVAFVEKLRAEGGCA